MIAILGDWHLSSSKPFHRAVAEASLSWFASWAGNRKGNILIHVGDLVNNAVNAGLVIEYVERFVNTSNFDHIYIIPGNHDVKRKDHVSQLAYQFLDKRDNVTIFSRATVASVQGKSVLFMPHFIPGPYEESMRDQYSKAHETFPGPYDLTVGHFNDEWVGLSPSHSILNLDKINTKLLCLGHIHVRVHPDRYIGSMFATRVNETEPNRAAWWIHDDGTKTEEPLPTFCEYQTVEYPQELPETTGEVVVYTVTNCPSERAARERYGDDLYIRKVVKPLAATELGLSTSQVDIHSMSLKDLFREFQRTTVLDRRVSSLCTSLLH